MKAVAATFEASTKTFVFGNIVLQILMAGSLQLLWGMINALQLIVHLPLFQIAFPYNAQFFFSTLIDLTKFQIVPVDFLLEKIFEFSDSFKEEDGAAPDNYKSLSYTDTNMISNLGFLLFVLFAIMLFSLLVIAMRFALLRC